MGISTPGGRSLTLEEKRKIILAYEEAMAGRLASQVLEKPVPPIWMILIPVFFVFYAWKIKEYSNGLKTFADHYLVSRRRALETAYEAVRNNTIPEVEPLVARAEALPPEVRPLYRDWISLLIDHYHNLLTAKGESVEDMIRTHYRNKSNYLFVANRLSSAEKNFNSALVPKVEGDREDVHFIADRMQQSLIALSREEVEKVFS